MKRLLITESEKKNILSLYYNGQTYGIQHENLSENFSIILNEQAWIYYYVPSGNLSLGALNYAKLEETQKGKIPEDGIDAKYVFPNIFYVKQNFPSTIPISKYTDAKKKKEGEEIRRTLNPEIQDAIKKEQNAAREKELNVQNNPKGYTIDKVISWGGLGLNILSGIVRGPIGWTAFFAGTLLNILELKRMHDNGANEYDKTLFIAFTLLNLDDVRFLIKGKGFQEQAVEYVFNLFRSSPSTAWKLLKDNKVYKTFVEALTNPNNLKTLNKLLQPKLVQEATKSIKNLITSQPFIWVVGFLKNLFSKSVKLTNTLLSWTFNITRFATKAGAGVSVIYCTFDELWKLFYGPNEEKMKLRDRSGFRGFLRWVANNPFDSSLQEEFKDKFSLIEIDPDFKVLIEKELVDLEKQGKTLEDLGGQSTIKKISEYSGYEDVEPYLQEIGDGIFQAIDGVGTTVDLLYKSVEKISNMSQFKVINWYLVKRYGETFFELVNDPFELSYNEKGRLWSKLNVRMQNQWKFDKGGSGKIMTVNRLTYD